MKNIYGSVKKIASIFTLIWLLLQSEYLFGVMYIDLSGYGSSTNVDLESRKDTSISASISVAVSEYFRVGISHRRAYSHKEGYRTGKFSDTGQAYYYAFEDDTETLTSSVDLTLFLYHGVLSPFIFGGVAWKDYYTTLSVPSEIYKSRAKLYKVPTYGLGVSVMLDRNFRLKISQTFSPGIKTNLVDGREEEENILESYTQIGINYQL